MYYEWAIKLLGIYKKSMMIRKVCWMCYKSDGKFMIKYFKYKVTKYKVTKLCLSSLLCPFIIIWKENDVFSFESS